MSFNPQREAVVRVHAILDTIGRQGRPAVIPLSDYADAETFNFLLPGNGWTFEEWRAVNQEVAAQLCAKGFNVQLVRLEMAAFIDWLARYDLRNSPQNRAQYVSWNIMQDTHKPQPLPD